jgi:hypothetical protein
MSSSRLLTINLMLLCQLKQGIILAGPDILAPKAQRPFRVLLSVPCDKCI